jgi:ribonuclease J
MRIAGHVTTGRVPTFDGAPVPDEVLRERAQLGRAGVLVVAYALDERGRLAGDAECTCMGVLGELERDVLARARRAVEAALDGAGGTPDERATRVKLAARKVVEAHTGRKPQVVVTELGRGSR